MDRKMSETEQKIRYALAGIIIMLFSFVILAQYLGKIIAYTFFFLTLIIVGYIVYIKYGKKFMQKEEKENKIELEVYR